MRRPLGLQRGPRPVLAPVTRQTVGKFLRCARLDENRNVPFCEWTPRGRVGRVGRVGLSFWIIFCLRNFQFYSFEYFCIAFVWNGIEQIWNEIRIRRLFDESKKFYRFLLDFLHFYRFSYSDFLKIFSFSLLF